MEIDALKIYNIAHREMELAEAAFEKAKTGLKDGSISITEYFNIFQDLKHKTAACKVAMKNKRAVASRR